MKFFILAYSFLIMSVLIYTLRINGFIFLHWIFTIYAFNFGFLLEIIVLSFALSETLRLEKQEKEIAQKRVIEQHEENKTLREAYTTQLESKVIERTQALKDANEEISRINEYLKQKNIKLELDTENLKKERIEAKLIPMLDFRIQFPDENTCKKLLTTQKWKSENFICKKCACTLEIPFDEYSKRCAQCKYVESCTSHTLFHALKIPLPEAFYMVYAVFTQKTVSAEELSKETGISDKSCASFKKKILEVEKNLKPKQRKLGWVALLGEMI